MSIPAGYEISDDPARMDRIAIHAALSATYWAKNIPLGVVEQAIRHSLCFGVFYAQAQVGFARVITDRATFGYLADVYILEPHRGQGLAQALLRRVLAHPDLQNLRRFVLVTRDAHRLYESFGFAPLQNPERYLEINRRNLYLESASS